MLRSDGAPFSPPAPPPFSPPFSLPFSPPAPRSALSRALGVVLCLTALAGASCGQSSISVLPGVVNNPSNLTLRREILSYGQRQLCTEMQKRSVPLKLRDEDPATGRFYPTSCIAQELANGHLMIQFGGHGYAWTNITKRIGFDASAAVEYEQDFLLHEGTMYVYFRPASTTAAKFTTRLVEQPTPAAVGPVALPQGTAYADALGAQLMKSELARGFTVLREEDGAVQFGLGVVEKGARPPEPYARQDNGKLRLINERTEVHQNQRDYIGPLHVTGNGEALTLTLSVDGAPAIDALIVTRGVGDQWLQAYTTQPVATPPVSTALVDEAVTGGMIWRKTVALPKGFYYLVLDNTSVAGRTQPSGVPHDDRAAMVSVAVELGDAP